MKVEIVNDRAKKHKIIKDIVFYISLILLFFILLQKGLAYAITLAICVSLPFIILHLKYFIRWVKEFDRETDRIIAEKKRRAENSYK